jgi:hypothetical protein
MRPNKQVVTQVRISNAALLDRLVDDLRQRPDTVVAVTGPNTIEVSLLGSYHAEAMRLAVDLLLRAWEAAQRARGYDVRLEIT